MSVKQDDMTGSMLGGNKVDLLYFLYVCVGLTTLPRQGSKARVFADSGIAARL